MYFVSISLTGAQTSYQRMEKLALDHFITSRKMRHYFQSFSITVLTEHPLQSIIVNSEATRQIIKWATKLNLYGVNYKPKTTIKGHVLADFMAEFTPGAPTQRDSQEG